MKIILNIKIELPFKLILTISTPSFNEESQNFILFTRQIIYPLSRQTHAQKWTVSRMDNSGTLNNSRSRREISTAHTVKRFHGIRRSVHGGGTRRWDTSYAQNFLLLESVCSRNLEYMVMRCEYTHVLLNRLLPSLQFLSFPLIERTIVNFHRCDSNCWNVFSIIITSLRRIWFQLSWY